MASDDVLREAAARAGTGRLTVLHVLDSGATGVPMSPAGVEQELLAQGRLASQVGDALAARVRAVTGRDAAIEIEPGSPHEVIVQRARALGNATIVLGASGSGGRPHGLLGRVATHVVRHAPASVIVVRRRHPGGRVIAAVDFSESSEQAFVEATRVVRVQQRPLVLLHCLESIAAAYALGDPAMSPAPISPIPAEELDREAQRAAEARLQSLLTSARIDGEVLVVQEPPTTAIPHVAERLGADLIVVATAGRTGLPRLLLGSVAESVVAHAPCSVLVVRQHRADAG